MWIVAGEVERTRNSFEPCRLTLTVQHYRCNMKTMNMTRKIMLESKRVHEPWDNDAARWNDHPITTNPQTDYQQGQNVYAEHFLYDQGNLQGEMHGNDWPDHHNEDEDKSMYEISGRASEDGPDDVYLGGDGYKAPGHYQQNNVYHLPENFRPYTNGHPQEFNKPHSKIANFADVKKEHLKCSTLEATNSQTMDPYKVIYKPYQNNIQQTGSISPDPAKTKELFEEMQQEFLGTGENASDNMQILQLQVINKAKGRQLEELNTQLEERSQQIRYLSHQLAIVKDEKDGMCLSLQESQKLYQNGKEREVQLEGQIKALETQIQTLTANEEQLVKQSKVAEVAMESMQQQLLELRRSDALQRAREQHEAIVATLKQKYEEEILSLQQRVDARNTALQEQTELCCHLKAHVKQLERTLEESKLEKTEIINRLSRSLEESQNQCANLLQTGFVQETNQLRIQLQQAQSAQLISNEMNKALQEELKELKEEIVLYESAAKHGIFLSDPGGELSVDMTDSYVDLGIKKVNKKLKLHSATQNKVVDNKLSKDDIILELKAELERLLNSNRTKRNQISRLQNDLKDCERTIDDLKKQQPKGRNAESQPDSLLSSSSEELLRLKKENRSLQEVAESHSACIQELKENQEKIKNVNQDLCHQMSQMIQESDRDKQEALDRCERTYRQHYEDMKIKYCEDLVEKHAVEKEKLIHAYEENITQLKADIDELNKEMLAVKECYIAVCKERDEQEATLKAALAQEQKLKEEKFKKQLLEEKEESLGRLRTELEETYKNSIVTAKAQWQKEREAGIKQCIEDEVGAAKAFWEREQKEIKEQAIQEVEKEWQHRLDQAVEETKRNVAESKDCCSQTEQVTITDESLSKVIAKAVDEQTLVLQEALKEKEKTMREHEVRHHENIASQVESALTKARARWLQELTELEEYKVHLKAAREKWEKECDIDTAKQVSLAVSAAEEKWKKELENTDEARVRTKELEERILSLKRELELKQEEVPAIIKTELAKARTQWNKEKQEEVLRIQHQNEKDYHSFLNDHRHKINEVLAKAKEDFAKQKKDLLDQKEAELKMCLDRKQQEWAAHEAKRFQNEVCQYEDRVLVQVELILDEMHTDLVRCAADEHTWQAKWSTPPPVETHLQFKDKLIFCLQKAYKGTIYAILEKTKLWWNEKCEGLDYNLKDPEHPCMQSGEGETGDKVRPSMYSVEQQVELQRRLRKQPALQETEVDADSEYKKISQLPQEDVCCEGCCQQLERKEKECQDLRKKLDKACRHLQLAVKEHKAKSEQVQENEKIVEALIEENSAMKTRLEDLKPCNMPPRSSSEGCISKTCTPCDEKALEEMRSQYIKAVGKIKSDMLRYIRESKERAAEIIKAEVLRERQETARKMRKYYLICLQQLLIDDGKHEGAEKKIICAAGKLATMAKILETPVRNSSQSKAIHSALSQNSKLLTGVEEFKRNCMHQPRPTPAESQTHGESIGQKSSNSVAQKRIPCSLRRQLDAESQPVLTSNIQAVRRSFKQLDDTSVGKAPAECVSEDRSMNRDLPRGVNAAALQNLPSQVSQVKFLNTQPTDCTNGGSDSGASYVLLKSENERPAKQDLQCIQTSRHQKATCEKTQVFEVQETPVRDEESSTDWSLVSETLHLDSNDVSLYYMQKAHSSAQAESCERFPTTKQFSRAKEEVSMFCQQAGYKDKALTTKSQARNYTKGDLMMIPHHMPYQRSGKLSPASAQPSSEVLCPSAGKSYNLLPLRKRIPDTTAFQQDSGFDSPQINFD
ncbi:centrosomal protein of 152 kDa isoform X3 [Hemicordylus capensis]|uniref:centrosomal protein of 152 kDa isoform X3 n=2 Tax=Hemicordylus capensis TaxID=884348 RepID=UPI0023029B96|nr:centrosomal protein of 152 kDa isoform X3 [Hemicordylus capensis]